MTAHGEEAAPHQPDYRGLGPRPPPRYRTSPYSLREHVLTAGRNSGQTLTWPQGLESSDEFTLRVPAGPARRAPSQNLR